ncbi:pre-mRNA-splicing factor 38-like [Phoenix dactylifera]|uniref:Pre-mRNA-splicing factor 38 n=1 Tax=Phoenix dactylifera TaxID=42345 RepID=A0A8B9A442_PHODC|nr:pre-mRNA-splicing factor 38 [Phoenix dactylifera]XP_038980432.1 pre-mRNA-splicing factor 38-like [Phoenix dactylifera]
MANRTDPAAKSIHGTNPQNLVEKILRSKIYQNTYWKEQCFGLTAETLVDKAMELDHLGGTYGGNRKPTPFMCLVMKMLQIQPEKDIVVEFIKNEDYKYVRVLGAFYMRLTGSVTDVYQYLEPLYNDYRKLRRKLPDGKFCLTHVDELIDELLTRDYSCDVALPRVQKRWTLEASGILEPRRSALEEDFEEEEEKEEDEQAMDAYEADTHEKDYYHGRSPTRERDRDRKRDSYRYHRDRDYDRDYGRGRERDRDRDRERDRDRDRERDRDRDRDRHRARDEKDYGRERERERDRDGRERERRDRDRGRRRSRSRSRSRDRRERDREDGDYRKRRARGSVSPRRRPEEDGGAREEPRRKKEKKEKKSDGTDHPDPEIAEANRLRASLGLAPLKL